MSLKYGDRVVTDTKWNIEGVGTGYLKGVEVPDPHRSGHLTIETDPARVNVLLSQYKVPDEDGRMGDIPRLMVECIDPKGEVEAMYGHTRLCFYARDNVQPFWQVLSNGEEYCFCTEIEGIEYWMPNDEDYTIRVKDGELEQDTDFFEMHDFEYPDSDYAYVNRGGKLMCRFEAEG